LSPLPKRVRRKRGRPSKDDQLVIELALALEVAWSMGAQQARDFALAVLEGTLARPMKVPRGCRKAPARSKITGFELPYTVKGREATIARKIKREHGVRRDVVMAWFELLLAKDADLIRCLRAIADALRGVA
jgi:hypothetical protein